MRRLQDVIYKIDNNNNKYSNIFYFADSRTSSLTDSETDSDVLFENRSKQNTILRFNGNSASKKHGKYGNNKLSRKIKT